MSSSEDSEHEKKSSIVMNVTDTQYEIVKYVGSQIMNWHLNEDPDLPQWDVNWVDLGIQSD